MSNAELQFTVVVPTYNRARFIGRTLRSVLEQVYCNYEVVVVDDASTDDTEQVISAISDSRIRYIRQKVNLERGAARNCGIRNARGQYVTFLDSDDLLKPSFLAEAADYIREHPDAAVFYFGSDVVRPNGEVVRKWCAIPSPINDSLVDGNYLNCTGVFVKRRVLAEFPFSEDRDLSGSEDYELWMRLAASFPIYTSAKSTSCLVEHDSRSVHTQSACALQKRIALLKMCLESNQMVRARFGRVMGRLSACLNLYLALHLVLASHFREGVRVLIQTTLRYPRVIFMLRFWIVLSKFVR